jgi:hypothetical protein
MVPERMKVLVTVKAAPEPSTTYGDTVCVAGVRVDSSPPRWVRLYPVPFRHLSSDQQFRKYDVVEVDTLPAKRDSRGESRRPIWESLTVVGHLGTKAARDRALAPMIGPSMCALLAAVQRDIDAQSLGLVELRDFDRLEITRHPGWTPAQQRAVQLSLETTTLFGAPDKPAPPLQAPKFIVRVRYRCASSSCPGHGPSLLDFELAALQYRGRAMDDDGLIELIRRKFEYEQFSDTQRTSLFVGNIADPPKRRSFSALGLHHVPDLSDWGTTLF